MTISSSRPDDACPDPAADVVDTSAAERTPPAGPAMPLHVSAPRIECDALQCTACLKICPDRVAADDSR